MSNESTPDTLKTLDAGGKTYHYHSLPDAADALGNIDRLPKTLKILLENQLRFAEDESVAREDMQALVDWQQQGHSDREIGYRPARVLMQDFTGVPGVVDLASMRAAVESLGEDPARINPLSPVDLVIDHSVMVDKFGNPTAFKDNVAIEMERNHERYEFLRWGQQAFDNFRVVPPGTGICHQVNLEYLGKTVWTKTQNGKTLAYPDTLVGTDSHTTMINGLGVLGWGVGGIEAEAAMLGQPVSMLIPEVVGFKLTGKLREGITATDLVLTVTEMLRKKGVVGKFVEFYGDGLKDLPLADRATIANMAPEYGATCGFFPVDDETLNYMRLTGREDEQIALVEAYCKAQGLWREPGSEPVFTDTLHLDMNEVEASLAGPKRPQDRVELKDMPAAFSQVMEDDGKKPETNEGKLDSEGGQTAVGVERSYEHADSQDVNFKGQDFTLDPGAVVIAAITSCTNTSNPSVMMAAGLVARKAREKGLTTKPWVKTSLAPGSKVVTDYLAAANLDDDLDALGFNLVGYGCTTCIGNSGPLPDAVAEGIREGDLCVASVLSGNRNFEGRIHQDVRANYLASPPLVVAYALAGTMAKDLYSEPLGTDSDGNQVYLKDIWPSQREVSELIRGNVSPEMYREQYANVFEGDANWQSIDAPAGELFDWRPSTYVKNPPYFEGMTSTPEPLRDLRGARCLVYVGDSITTDHISPAGAIPPDSPAGQYLQAQGVAPKDFNSYGSRRGNHEVMVRGTFANVRLRNKMAPGTEGAWTTHMPSGERMSIYDASVRYQQEGTPLVVLAGKEYGTGSSRDWAAKGTRLLGVQAVIAESYERIHRSNLVGFGVLPLQFQEGEDPESLGLTGSEAFDIEGITEQPETVSVTARRDDGTKIEFQARVRVDTPQEWAYYRHGSILHYVLRDLANQAA